VTALSYWVRFDFFLPSHKKLAGPALLISERAGGVLAGDRFRVRLSLAFADVVLENFALVAFAAAGLSRVCGLNGLD
jgi:hypothetical protein